MKTPGAENFDAVTIPRDVRNMLRLGGTQLRRQYVDSVDRHMGPEYAERLKAAFLAEWEKLNKEAK